MANYHKTIQGDTFDDLALVYYNDEKLASTIIQANPDYCDVLIFDEGIVLFIPDAPEAALPTSLPPWRRDE